MGMLVSEIFCKIALMEMVLTTQELIPNGTAKIIKITRRVENYLSTSLHIREVFLLWKLNYKNIVYQLH